MYSQVCFEEMDGLTSRGHATLQLVVSVGRLVGHIFEFRAVFALLLLPNCPRLDCRVSGLVPCFDAFSVAAPKGSLIYVFTQGNFLLLLLLLHPSPLKS